MTTEHLNEFEHSESGKRDPNSDALQIERALAQLRPLTGVDVEAFTFTALLRNGMVLTGMGGEHSTLIRCAMQSLAVLNEKTGDDNDN